MAIGNETFNNELYQLLKVRGYRPTPLNSQNQRVKASQEADVIEFDFVKDGEDYGKVWISIDDASNVCVYFDDEQAESPSNATPGAEYDDTWTGLLKHLKQWAQRRQLSFELANKDRLGDDMRQRDYYKMKEKLGESYHPMGKKASYNDAVPNVKIVLQHNRSLEEGEARFRNVARIYLENVDGERFLAPTNKPGLARVYARHIAEGGLPNDEKWNHIKSICEEYQQMAGFVRATRKGQFNESAQQLVNEGINHYNNLRETLHKLAGHRGYHAYFESYTPALMEDETDVSINELFVQETMDPRIESVMPILSRLHKKVSENSTVNVDALAEWADNIISEKLEADGDKADKKDSKKKSKKHEKEDEEDSEEKVIGVGPLAKIRSRAEKKMSGKAAKALGLAEMDKEHGSKRDFDPRGPEKTGKPISPKMMAKKALKSLNRGMKGWEKGIHDVDTVKAATKTLSPDSKEELLKAKVGKGSPAELQQKLIKREKNKQVDESYPSNVKQYASDLAKEMRREKYDWEPVDLSDPEEAIEDAREQLSMFATSNMCDFFGDYDSTEQLQIIKMFNKKFGNLEEDLGPEQKRVGQLGPTEKVKNNNIGKLVGASESMNYDDEDLIAEGILDTIKSRVKSFLPKKPAAAPAEPKKAPGIVGKTQQSSGLNDYIKKVAADLNAADPKTKIALVKELVGVMADRKGYPEWDNVIGSVKGILKRAGVNPNVAAAANAKLQAGQTFESAMQEAINLLLESTGLTMQILNESEDLLDIRRLAGL